MNQELRKLKVLDLILEQFQIASISYQIGGSCMLFLRGWVSTFDDLDILIDERDYERVEAVMNHLGKRVIVPPNPLYETRHFLNYRLGDVKCDIMAGLSIIHQGKPHYFPYDENKCDLVNFQGKSYRLGTSDDWCEYYRLMNREDKVNLIKSHRKERL